MKWTLEKLKEEALKYKTKIEFRNNSSGYQSALKRNMLDEVCSHMISARHSWTNEELDLAASEYLSRSEFEFKNPKAYSTALRRNLMDKICSHMRDPLTKPYTLEELKEEALKYKNRSDFAKKSGGAYNAAKKRDEFERIVSHMDKPSNEKYTLEELKEEALKYKSKGEFYRMSKNIYQVAVKRSDYNEICSHMLDAHVSWDIDSLRVEALNYNSRVKFQEKSKAAYIAAYRREVLDEICAHMEDIHIPSAPEIDLLETLKISYPKAQKFKELKIKIADRPYVNSFEIDIYVPELRKGIEFDGKYWHSEDGLKRSHPSWPEDGIKNYHQIKDNYFLSKGIKILHIKGEDWKNNREDCIQRCLDFLK
jgi:hypothetical protein